MHIWQELRLNNLFSGIQEVCHGWIEEERANANRKERPQIEFSLEFSEMFKELE